MKFPSIRRQTHLVQATNNRKTAAATAGKASHRLNMEYITDKHF